MYDVTLRLDVSVHCLPPQAKRVAVRDPQGVDRQRIACAPIDLQAGLPVSFDEVMEQLATWPDAFVEPDGSFIVRGAARRDGVEVSWVVEGSLLDRGDCLQYADLWGECDAATLDRLTTLLGANRAPLMVQLRREGVFLDLATLKKWPSVSNG